MMHEREKSDPAVVAVKPVNAAERSAAESVEPKAGAEGNASQHSTGRAQKRATVSQGLEPIRHVRRHTPEVGAVCGKAARTVLCGGRSVMSVPTATCIDVAFAASRDDEDLLADGASGRLHLCRLEIGPLIVRVYKQGNHGGCGHQLEQQLQSFRPQRDIE